MGHLRVAQNCECHITFYCNVRPTGSSRRGRGTMLLCVNGGIAGVCSDHHCLASGPEKPLKLLTRSNCTLIYQIMVFTQLHLNKSNQLRLNSEWTQPPSTVSKTPPGKDLALSFFYAVWRKCCVCSRAFMHIMVHSLLKHYRIQQHQQEEIGPQRQRLSFYAAARFCFIHTYIDHTFNRYDSVHLWQDRTRKQN